MKKILPLLIVGILVLSVNGTGFTVGENTKREIINGDFEIGTKYNYIRSYNKGGGIFILNMTSKTDFSGFVFLCLKSNPNLNAKLDRKILNKESSVAEITIFPNELIEIKTYQIILYAIHFKMPIITKIVHFLGNILSKQLYFSSSHLCNHLNTSFLRNHLFGIKKLIFYVEMFNWSSDSLPNALGKKDELIKWLESEHPEFGTFLDKKWSVYVTYPGILVVEHWTFLYEKWEMRICFHVMIPPYNWSKIFLRKRGEVHPIFAAMRESDGTTYEIPLSEYPTHYGY